MRASASQSKPASSPSLVPCTPVCGRPCCSLQGARGARPHCAAQAGCRTPAPRLAKRGLLTVPGPRRILGADDHPDHARGLAGYLGQLSREVFKGGPVSEGEEEEERVCVLLASLGRGRPTRVCCELVTLGPEAVGREVFPPPVHSQPGRQARSGSGWSRGSAQSPPAWASVLGLSCRPLAPADRSGPA